MPISREELYATLPPPPPIDRLISWQIIAHEIGLWVIFNEVNKRWAVYHDIFFWGSILWALSSGPGRTLRKLFSPCVRRCAVGSQQKNKFHDTLLQMVTMRWPREGLTTGRYSLTLFVGEWPWSQYRGSSSDIYLASAASRRRYSSEFAPSMQRQRHF